MNLTLRISIAVALLLFFVVIFCLLRKKSLALKYTLLWLAFGGVMVLIAAFPNAFWFLLRLIGIVEVYNGLFAVMIFALIIILISITAIVSKQNEKLRQLIQKCATYEKRIRELEIEVNRQKKED